MAQLYHQDAETEKHSDLLFMCGVIEAIGRARKLRRGKVVERIGMEGLHWMYKNACVLHCVSLEQTVDECVKKFRIGRGTYDNVGAFQGKAPHPYVLGEIYAYLIQDVAGAEKDVLDVLFAVYTSPFIEQMDDYGSGLYARGREQLHVHYLAGLQLAPQGGQY